METATGVEVASVSMDGCVACKARVWGTPGASRGRGPADPLTQRLEHAACLA